MSNVVTKAVNYLHSVTPDEVEVKYNDSTDNIELHDTETGKVVGSLSADWVVHKTPWHWDDNLLEVLKTYGGLIAGVWKTLTTSVNKK